MAEFQAHADLTVSVDQSSLRSARRQIENDLGDVSVGIAPTGGGGAVGSRGPEPATVDLSRRQLGQQESLVELAQARNELLEDLRGQGPGGGGGAGAGGTLLQVQGTRSLLGGAAGGAAAGAAGLGGLAAAGGVGTLGLLVSLFGEGTSEGRSPTGLGAPGDQRQGLPQGDLQTSLEQIFDITINQETQVSGPASSAEARRQFAQEQFADSREVESTVRTELQRFEQRLKRELGGGTGSRTVHGVLGTEPGE